MTAEETRRGALNRVDYLRGRGGADLYIALEGGIEVTEDGPYTFAYVVIADATRVSVGRSAAMPLPPRVHAALTPQAELGAVMDRLFNTHNSKQQGGAIGLLTRGQATRESAYTQALVLAMAPFLHPEIYAP
jgi:inosine/xanthosine triphosphatase